LHDWKIACPSYTLFTEGQPCRRCPSGNVVSAVRHRCVKSSASASALAATEAWIARRRGSYEKVQRFIAPSRFAAEVAREAGIDPSRVAHVPNFLPDAKLVAPTSVRERPPVLLYAGRLDATKGIRQLLEAFGRVGSPAVLRIAGSGELEADVEAVNMRNPRIEYLGRVEQAELMTQFDEARAVVLPSIWEDNGPLVILEAQARGAALVVTDRGGPREFVRDGESGFVVRADDAEALAAAMRRLLEEPQLARRFGETARRDVRAGHNAARHYEDLLSVYREAMQEV
jgi:glycosyltransferase involved in cell wall biosynthesis